MDSMSKSLQNMSKLYRDKPRPQEIEASEGHLKDPIMFQEGEQNAIPQQGMEAHGFTPIQSVDERMQASQLGVDPQLLKAVLEQMMQAQAVPQAVPEQAPHEGLGAVEGEDSDRIQEESDLAPKKKSGLPDMPIKKEHSLDKYKKLQNAGPGMAPYLPKEID